MQKLRRLHLYLGCFFAPMLLFFAVSGLWQTFRLNDKVPALKALSAIHTLSRHKGEGVQIVTPFLTVFVAVMAVGLIFSIVTGVVMAFKFGRGPAAWGSLIGGILIPLAFIVFATL